MIQVATSADAGWTTWPLHPSYPPVMEQIVLQAAAGRLAERNVRVGQPLDQALPAVGRRGRRHGASLPDGQPSPLKLQAAGGVSQLHFEETELSGAVPGEDRARRWRSRSTFAANPDPAESDPAKLDRAGLADAVPGWNFAYLTNWRELTGNAASVGRRGELHRPLLYGVLRLAAGRIVPGLEVRASCPLEREDSPHRDGLAAPQTGRSTGRRAAPRPARRSRPRSGSSSRGRRGSLLARRARLRRR